MSPKHLQVEYFQFEYHCVFTSRSSTKTAFPLFSWLFQRVSYMYIQQILCNKIHCKKSR